MALRSLLRTRGRKVIAGSIAGVILLAGIAFVPNASAASGVCTANGKIFGTDTYLCNNYGTTPIFSNPWTGDWLGVNGHQISTMYAGNNWVVCAFRGGANPSVGSASNNYWLYTLGDSPKAWGWMPATFVRQGNNGEIPPVAGGAIPLCAESLVFGGATTPTPAAGPAPREANLGQQPAPITRESPLAVRTINGRDSGECARLARIKGVTTIAPDGSRRVDIFVKGDSEVEDYDVQVRINGGQQVAEFDFKPANARFTEYVYVNSYQLRKGLDETAYLRLFVNNAKEPVASDYDCVARATYIYSGAR